MKQIFEERTDTDAISEQKPRQNRWLVAIEKVFMFMWDSSPAIGLVVFILVLWEVLSVRGILKSYIAPPPSDVLGAIFSNLPIFWNNTWVTIKEVIFGYAVGLGAGIPLGIAIAYSKRLEKALYPLVVISQTIPVIALAPILVTWFGFNIWPKLIVVAMITFFPITVSVVDGLQSVDSEILRFLRSLGATERQLFFKIKVPSALPQVFIGIKVSMTYVVIAAVIGEWVGAEFGLGAMMLRAQNVYYMDIVFATVLLMVALGFVALQLAILAEHIAIPWHVAKIKRT